jgi:hypothetical protein
VGAGVAAFALLLWSGVVVCPTARLLHVPCPGCGATRATKAFLALDFANVVRFNPVGPLMAAAIAIFAARSLYLVARQGNVNGIGEGRIGGAIVPTFLTLALAEIVIWVARFFGLFGGPCPV